jgi:8-oxo-dGTP pyrophosphatase MutT (NUDIX family)
MPVHSTSAAPGPPRAPFRPDRPAVAELAAGAVVMRAGRDAVLLLHHATQRRWCFPKGHVEAGESVEEAARREITEETGLSRFELGPELATVHYRFYDPRRDVSVAKTTVYYLVETSDLAVVAEPLFDEHEWVPVAEARGRVAFDEERAVLDAIGSARPRRPSGA